MWVAPRGMARLISLLMMGELRLSGNRTVMEHEMSREPYSQKSGWINHSNERIFQVMTFKKVFTQLYYL